ncbi:PEP-CTERM sorting domain-containing protein [Tautonia rosea]|uniref:PEP-CTERM sorting domain-containing protein n=1 Tax=Tautonia rosea TaxID=2728037 RepID=UPI0014761FB1|nr:PEP-CTERM sorting domain-containing protein [Tautonia rosea]
MELRSRVFGILALLGVAIPAQAGQIYVNSPLVTIDSVGGTVANAKYRLSNTGFDVSLDNAPSTVTPADQVTATLGNVATTSGKVFEFMLEHRAGEGIIFSLDGPGSLDRTVSWGTFTTTPSGSNKANLNGKLPPSAFNSLVLSARATQAGSSFAFDDLNFSGAGLSLADGSFLSGTVTPSTGDPLGFINQRLYSNVNLADFNWTLTGTLTGTKLLTGGDETVRFNVGFQQVSATVVPEPSTLAMAGISSVALAGFGLHRRRRHRRAKHD